MKLFYFPVEKNTGVKFLIQCLITEVQQSAYILGCHYSYIRFISIAASYSLMSQTHPSCTLSCSNTVRHEYIHKAAQRQTQMYATEKCARVRNFDINTELKAAANKQTAPWTATPNLLCIVHQVPNCKYRAVQKLRAKKKMQVQITFLAGFILIVATQ